MPALGWSILKEAGIVIVRGVGVFDLAFLRSYMRATQVGGAVGYGKLFDLRQTDIEFSGDDLQAVGLLMRNTAPTTSGPVALLVGKNPPPLMLDMAILLKQRVGTSRRFRLFTDEPEARDWLAKTSRA